MENPDQILPGRGIDCGLATNRGVDHRQQSRRYLDYRNAAHEGGCYEAGEVSNNPSSDGNYSRIPTESFSEHFVRQARPAFPGFVGLAGFYGEDFDRA
jgi:hypothetical protein